MSFHHHRHDLGGGVGGRGGVGTSPLSLAPALSRGPSNNSSTLGRGLLSTVRLQSHGNTASATTTTTTTTTIALSNLSSLNASPLASASPPLGSTFRTLHQHLHPHHQQHHHSSRRHHHHPHHHTARQEFPPKPLSILGSRRSGLDVPWPRSADSTRIGHDADSSDDDRIFEPLDESSRHNEPEPPPAYHSVDGGVDHFDNSDDGGGKKQPARTKGTREKRSESRDLSAAAAPRGRGSVDSGKSRKDASSPAADSGAEDGVFAKASPVPVAKVLSPSPSSQTGPSSWSSSSSASGKPLMMPPPSAAPLPGRDQLPKTEHQNPSLTPEIESLWARSQAVLQTLRNHEMERRVNRVIALVDQTADRLRLALLQMYEDMLVLDDSFVLVRERNLDDMLWSVVFYSRIKELKSIIGKFEMDSNPNLSTAVAELNRHLDRAACFYRTLLLVIKSKWNLDPTAAAVGLFHGRDESEFGVPVEMLQRLVSKTVVFLGDIERYRRSHGDAADRSAEQLYMSACRLSPLQGKAFSQLAITSTEREEYFDVVYWYSLCLSNAEPFPLARENVSIFHGKTTQKLPIPNPPATSDCFVLMEAVKSLMIILHRDAIFFSDKSKPPRLLPALPADPVAAALQIRTNILSVIDTLFDSWIPRPSDATSKSPMAASLATSTQTSPNPHILPETHVDGAASTHLSPEAKPSPSSISALLLQVMTTLITGHSELGRRFAEAGNAKTSSSSSQSQSTSSPSASSSASASPNLRSKHLQPPPPSSSSSSTDGKLSAPAIRQRARCMQAVVAALALDIAQRCLRAVGVGSGAGALLSDVGSGADDGRATDGREGEVRAAMLPTVAVACGWLLASLDPVVLLRKYAGEVETLKPLGSSALSFSQSLADMANHLVATTADLDLIPHCLPEDTLLIGCTVLRPFYATLTARSIVAALQSAGSASGRVNVEEHDQIRLSRAGCLSVKMLDDKELAFFSFDAKQSKFTVLDGAARRDKIQQTATNLAIQYLQTQISQMEKEALPYAILDVGCFVHHLHIVKTLLELKTCIIVVPMDVIQDLDALKKGHGTTSARAREATRYLENAFRYPSAHLRMQQPDESDPFVGRSTGPADSPPTVADLRIPRHLRGVLACCLFYLRNRAPGGGGGSDGAAPPSVAFVTAERLGTLHEGQGAGRFAPTAGSPVRAESAAVGADGDEEDDGYEGVEEVCGAVGVPVFGCVRWCGMMRGRAAAAGSRKKCWRRR